MYAHLLSLTDKKIYIIVALLGAISALSFAPVFWFPVLFLCFPGLLFFVFHAKTAKYAFKLGLLFGFFHFVCGIYWVTFSILTQADKFWWLVPFAVTGMSAILSLYVAIPVVIAYVSHQKWFSRVMIFAGVWVIGELLRGYLKFSITLYGFPWNLIGYTLSSSLEMIQFASLVGIYGLSLITIICISLPVLLLQKDISKHHIIGIIAVLFIVLSAIWGWGSHRLNNASYEFAPNVMLRLVQAGIREHHGWDPLRRSQVVAENMMLSEASDGEDDPTHVIWSESSLPYLIDENSVHLGVLTDIIPRGGTLLTGSMRFGQGQEDVYSTIHAINDKGEIIDIYDKVHLVPFGEYIPFRKILPFIDSIVGGGDFSAGDQPRTFSIEGLPPVSPLICYDIIFPHTVYDPDNKPSWLLNLTNDSWFEKNITLGGKDYQISSGPYQHYEMARMRAIENGMSVVRVANTGISAVIDPFGQEVIRIELGEKQASQSQLPLMSADDYIYGNYKGVVDVIIFIICCLFALVFRKKIFIIK